MSKNYFTRIVLLFLFIFSYSNIYSKATEETNQKNEETSELKTTKKIPVIIGASVSHGYDITEKYGGPLSEQLSIDNYFKKVLKSSNKGFANISSLTFFMNPQKISDDQIDKTKKLSPSVIFAIDFLFWQIYGHFKNEEQRLDSFNNGLKLLEDFNCPIIIGNIPNAYRSIGKMLSKNQVPKENTINKANEILIKWSDSRKNVKILDFKTIMESSIKNEKIVTKHNTYEEGTTKSFLQKDKLHPTEKGCIAIVKMCLELLQKIVPNLTDEKINWTY